MNTKNAWAAYARTQELANLSNLSAHTWAAEEVLGVILEKIETRQEISTRQIDNLLTNRAATARHRQRLLAQHTHLFDQPTNENKRLEARLELDRHRRRCAAREWRVLCSVGLGYGYASIARAEGVPEATVKTWVRRARLKLDRADIPRR